MVDIKKEIEIVNGHNSSSYFWIMPVKVTDYSDSNCCDNVAELDCCEISIEEDDVAQYLSPFLYKYFDKHLEANKNRVNYCTEDNDNVCYLTEFEWYITHNFYTYASVGEMIVAMNDTIEALASGKENEFTARLREKRGTDTYELMFAKGMSEEQVKRYNDSRPTVDDTDIDIIIDFYQRFIYRMEHMMKVGKGKGYDLISFMGP